MSSVGSAIRTKQKQYESTIVDFIAKEAGHVICMSDDQPFLLLLRQTLFKQLGLTTSLTLVSVAVQLMRVIKNRSQVNPGMIVFMERILGGRDQSYLVRQFKEAYSGLRIIILTNDVEKEQLMLLHEIGADNFVTKPVSTNTLVEKLAFTLKPQSKLGQLIDTAKAHLAKDEPEEALELGRQILEIKPNSAAGFLVMGDAYRQLGDMQTARESYEKASEYAEMFIEPLRRLGELHGEMGDLGGRLKYLQRMDQLSPLNVERKVDMGEIHLSMGDSETAQALFDTAVEQVTKDALNQITNIANRIAELYMEKDPLVAEKYLRRSLEAKGKNLSREDLNTFNQLGINLRQQGRWQDALVEYEKALKIAPNDENLYYNMGMANAEGRNFLEARTCMSKALEINPDLPTISANIAYNIGVVFMYAGSRKDAAKHLRTALELNPGFAAARTALDRL